MIYFLGDEACVAGYLGVQEIGDIGLEQDDDSEDEEMQIEFKIYVGVRTVKIVVIKWIRDMKEKE